MGPELEIQLRNAEKQIEWMEQSFDMMDERIAEIKESYRTGGSKRRIQSKGHGCGGCASRTISFLSRKESTMSEQQLEEQLRKIREQVKTRVQRRIDLTRDTLNFLEANKNQMCGGCVEHKITLLKRKLDQLEERQR